jgi:tetratricopeptide (TPR) repeat protein
MRLAAMSNLGVLYWQAGDMWAAADLVAESLALSRQVGDTVRETVSVTNHGGLLAMLGRYQTAIDLLTGSRQRHLVSGNQSGLANVERMLALVYTDAKRPDLALGHAEVALRASIESADRRVEIFARIALAEAYRALGRFDEACDYFEAALDAARSLQFRYAETEALIGLGATRADRDGPAGVGDLADRVVEASRARRYAVLECLSLVLRSRVRLAVGDSGGARSDTELAWRIGRDRGYPVGEEAALVQLSLIRRALGDAVGAEIALADAAAVRAAVEPLDRDTAHPSPAAIRSGAFGPGESAGLNQ